MAVYSRAAAVVAPTRMVTSSRLSRPGRARSAGTYTLEVSSPGLERPLRTPGHFAAAVGERVKIKLLPGVEGDRRADGVLVSADDRTATVATDDGNRVLQLADVSKANTVFVWESTPKGSRKSATTTESTEEIR